VVEYLNTENTGKLRDFLRERYQERYFEPITTLIEGSRGTSEQEIPNRRNYGFAIMSLCCLLIETLQCYRDGMPTTSETEWNRSEEKGGVIKRINRTAPCDYKIDGINSGEKCFGKFFTQYAQLFPNVDGGDFYKEIRNGLLHQAQTKSGWKIVTYGELCAPSPEKTINRDKFAEALAMCFTSYLRELQNSQWTDDIWKMARRKIWWLTELSK